MTTSRRGDVPDPLGEVLDQVQQEGLGPVDVVEDEHERSATARVLDEAAHGPERLLGRPGLPDAEQRGGAGRDAGAIGCVLVEQRR